MKDYGPSTLIRESVRSVPSVKYAVGIGGIVSVIAIIGAFRIGLRVGAWGTFVMLVLMVGLLVFSALVQLAKSDKRTFYYPAVTMLWTFVALTCVTPCTLFSCIFFKRPIDLHDWLTGKFETATQVSTQAEVTAADANPDMVQAQVKAELIHKEIEALRQKGPPYAYVTAENCPDVWTNVNGKRISVKDPHGLWAVKPWPYEPLGIYIIEDKTHYYAAGEMRETGNEANPPLGCYPHVDGICAASLARAQSGQEITFQAWGYGGTGEYAYNWLGDNGEISNRDRFTTAFWGEGIKSASVRITSNGQSVVRQCKVLIKD